LLAGLLLFRLLYYIAPFALALITLGLRELWINFAAAAATEPPAPSPPPPQPGAPSGP